MAEQLTMLHQLSDLNPDGASGDKPSTFCGDVLGMKSFGARSQQFPLLNASWFCQRFAVSC